MTKVKQKFFPKKYPEKMAQLILNMLNYFKDYKRCIHILYQILDIDQQKTYFTMGQPYFMLPTLLC